MRKIIISLLLFFLLSYNTIVKPTIVDAFHNAYLSTKIGLAIAATCYIASGVLFQITNHYVDSLPKDLIDAAWKRCRKTYYFYTLPRWLNSLQEEAQGTTINNETNVKKAKIFSTACSIASSLFIVFACGVMFKALNEKDSTVLKDIRNFISRFFNKLDSHIAKMSK